MKTPTFAELLKAERRRLRLNQPDTAALFHALPVATLRNWESARNTPQPWAQALVLDYLHAYAPAADGSYIERGRLWPAKPPAD